MSVRPDEKTVEQTRSRGGALHIPLHDLLTRLEEVPHGEVWVHCAAGYRVTIAAGILAAHGRRTVVVDDDVDQARADGVLTLAAGYPLPCRRRAAPAAQPDHPAGAAERRGPRRP